MTMLVADITEEKHGFINLLDKWILDAEGEIEDCIEETKEWYRQGGISFTV